MADSEQERDDVRCHDDDEALAEVPVRGVRAVEGCEPGQDIETRKVVVDAEPSAVEDAVDQRGEREERNTATQTSHE